MLYKLPQILKVVVLYSYLFLAFGSLLEATHPPAPIVSSTPIPSAQVARLNGASAPAQLVIPRLNMKLSIIPGQYDPTSRTWTLTDTDVQFASMTALPNEKSGTTLLYGHNTHKVLAPTDQLVEGDTAQVITKDGRVFTYTFTSGTLVDPSDTSVLKQNDSSPQLTLLTCDGLWDEKRRLMTFSFVSVQ